MTVGDLPLVPFGARQRAEAMMMTGELMNEAILTYAPIPKAAQNARAFLPAFKSETVKSLLKKATKLRSTMGKVVLYNRVGGGGYKQALSNFFALKPNNIKTINTVKGEIKVGTLADGRTVKVRSFSSTKNNAQSRPTLEIRSKSNRGYEIRY
jgi:hypothetical protein